jgi:uncharacterized protein (TIGR03067 family)
MKTKLAVLVLLGTALASASVAVGGDAKGELKKFEGTWAIESGQRGGKAMPAADAEKITFTFAAGKFTQTYGDMEKEGTFNIDPGKKPPQIDMTLGDKTVEGVYAFKGGKLTLCVAEKGQGRPAKFESPEGSKNILLVLKRVKAKK